MAKQSTFDLSKEAIFSVCDELQSLGKKVTGESVRERIGGGSPNVIMSFLKEWKMSSKVMDKSLVVIEMPDEAINAVKIAAGIIWKAATEHQAQTIEAFRLECQKIEHEAYSEREEVMEIAEKLENENKQLNSEIENLKAQLIESQSKTVEQSEQINKLLLSNESLQLSLSEFKESANAMAVHVVKLQEIQVNMTVERDVAVKELNQLQVDYKRVFECKEQKIKEIASLTLQVQSQQMSLDADAKQNCELKAELKVLAKEVKELSNEASMLSGKLSVYEKMDKVKEVVKPVGRAKKITESEPQIVN
jgi:hypothetical protein